MAELPTDIPVAEWKEDCSRCEEVLDTLISASEKYGVQEAHQTLDGWRSKLKDLQLKIENPPKIKIALFGDTGQGKSSLLNALFDQPDLLPTDGFGMACTSVVTKIEIVARRPDDLDKEGFQAEITFISTEEWNQEIKVLRNEMVEGDEGDVDEVLERAETKLKAVYGSFKPEDLEKIIEKRKDITEKLKNGMQTTDIFDNASELQEEIEDYMVETSNEKQFWPIVRHVLIRVFHPQISGQGIVFVDLPGVADTNPVRVKIAEDERQSAKVLLVLSKIDRCLSNPTLKSIVGDQRSCEMEMDQQENIIVCTRTDEIPDLKRAKKHMTEEEWNEVKELDLNIKESRKTIAELEKQKASGDQDADLLSRLDRMKSQCKEMEESRVIKCGNFRNNSVKKNFFESTQSKVFCVSSMDYMKIAKNHVGDGKPTVFKEKEDTEIPQLRDFLQNIALQQRVKELELIRQQFWSVLTDTHVYLLNFQIGGKEQSQEEVKVELEKMRGGLKNIRSSLCLAITNTFKDQLFALVKDGLQDAVNSAVETSTKWGSGKKLSQTGNTGLSVNTYRATVVRDGYFKRRNGPTFDFNMDLAYPLIKKIVKPWMEVFRKEKWEQLIEREVKSPSAEIIQKYSEVVEGLLIQERSDEEVGKNLQCIREDALMKLERLTVFEEKIEQPQRQAHRVIAHTVQEKMKSTYKECAEQKEKGCFDKMKRIMQSQVEEKKEDIFQCTERNLKQTLLAIKKGVCDYVCDYLMDICDDYKQQMDPLWLNQVELHFRQEIEGSKKDLLAMLCKNDNGQAHQGESRKRPETMTTDEGKAPEKKPKQGPVPGNGRKGRGQKPRISRTQVPGPSGDSAVGSSTQTSGGQTDDGQQQSQGLSQRGDRSDATNYGKPIPDKEPVADIRLLVKTSESIGLIGASGTGFKVGSNFIMTASHVFEAAFDWLDRQFATDGNYLEIVNARLKEDHLFINFYVEDRRIEHRFRIRSVRYVNRQLDVAVAELDRDASHIESLSEFHDTKNRKVKFHFFGHDNADFHQYQDPNCATITKSEAQQCKKAIMNLPGPLSVREDYLSRYDIMGCSSEYLHFQCSFKQGGSGSPGLKVTGGKVKVLTMLIAGYPKDDYIRIKRPDLCVEEGTRMKAIKEDMERHDVWLCKNIFEKYAIYETLWYV